MVLLISLAFFGQSMASTVMPYHMMNMEWMFNQQWKTVLMAKDHGLD